MRFAATIVSLFVLVSLGFHKLASSADSGIPQKTETQKPRCRKFPIYPSTIVCDGKLYHLQADGRAYMGRIDQMTPLFVPTHGG